MSRGAISALGAAMVTLVAAAGALGAGPAKPVDPAAEPGARVSFELTRPTTPHLLVTFADTPSAATARARLAGLGRVTAVVPEAGIWSTVPRDVSRARDRALASRLTGGMALLMASAGKPIC